MPTQVILQRGQQATVVKSAPNPSLRRLRKRRELTNVDISASPRLAGYLFIFTAYVVLLVSNATYEIIVIENENQADSIFERPKISRWKHSSSLYGSAVMIFLNVIIIGAHFDTSICPKFWRNIFRDGSKGEASILIFFIFAALFLVYVSTSNNASGGFVGLNANIYFSSWFGFLATIYTYTVWCNEGPQGIVKKLKDSSRKTTFYWTLTLLFSTVTLLSLLDIVIGSGGISELMVINHLTMIMSCIASVICCVFALLMNICFSPNHNQSIPLVLSQRGEWNIFDWRVLEGVLLLVMGSFWTLVVYRFTGINGLVNGPCNAYFGAWGSFFWSISTVASWMKEHQFRLGCFRNNE